MKRFFLVKFGFGQLDKVSLPEEEVEKAIYAQLKGSPVRLGNSYVNGKNIISITPHYHKHTGWYDSYEPNTGDDWVQIKRDCPSYDGVLEAYQERVKQLISSGKESLLGTLGTLEPKQIESSKRIGGIKSIGDLIK